MPCKQALDSSEWMVNSPVLPTAKPILHCKGKLDVCSKWNITTSHHVLCLSGQVFHGLGHSLLVMYKRLLSRLVIRLTCNPMSLPKNEDTWPHSFIVYTIILTLLSQKLFFSRQPHLLNDKLENVGRFFFLVCGSQLVSDREAV